MAVIFQKQIESIYRRRLYNRCDDMGIARYFSAEDFPGLRSAPFAFPSKAGNTLKGYFYSYENPISGRIVVFDHGMGGGHRSYMQEIHRLAKAGYLVFAYDHTGCMESEGENTNGFAQSLSDLDACMEALKGEKVLEGYSFSVIGHSWGGFSTMNIAALHPDITHVVSMSGFISVKRIVEQTFDGILKPYRKAVLELERQVNGKYADFDGMESLEDTHAKVLLIYSENDPIVKMSCHCDPLMRALGDKGNIAFRLEEGKAHNPTYTTDAVKYKDGFFAELQKLRKSKASSEELKAFMESYDWRRMTEQDKKVWERIVSHLKA